MSYTFPTKGYDVAPAETESGLLSKRVAAAFGPLILLSIGFAKFHGASHHPAPIPVDIGGIESDIRTQLQRGHPLDRVESVTLTRTTGTRLDGRLVVVTDGKRSTAPCSVTLIDRTHNRWSCRWGQDERKIAPRVP